MEGSIFQLIHIFISPIERVGEKYKIEQIKGQHVLIHGVRKYGKYM